MLVEVSKEKGKSERRKKRARFSTLYVFSDSSHKSGVSMSLFGVQKCIKGNTVIYLLLM
jgi:hypothetical protein